MKTLRFTSILAFCFSFLMACGEGSRTFSQLDASVPAKTYQFKLNGQCWDSQTNDVHTFLRPCSTSNSSKVQIYPYSGALYANNSDYVRIMTLNASTFFRCLTATRPASGIGGDLIWSNCSNSGSSKEDQEAQKFYISRTGNTFQLFNYKAFFLNFPDKQSICVVKLTGSPLVTDNFGCAQSQTWTITQLN